MNPPSVEVAKSLYSGMSRLIFVLLFVPVALFLFFGALLEPDSKDGFGRSKTSFWECKDWWWLIGMVVIAQVALLVMFAYLVYIL